MPASGPSSRRPICPTARTLLQALLGAYASHAPNAMASQAIDMSVFVCFDNTHDRSHHYLSCRTYRRSLAIDTLQFLLYTEQRAATCLDCSVFIWEK